MKETLYWFLFFAVVLCEFSPYMNTKNLIKKSALVVIAIGCALKVENKEFYLIEIGSIIFFVACCARSYWAVLHNKSSRRATD